MSQLTILTIEYLNLENPKFETVQTVQTVLMIL
jgi:hypothetical protein